MCETEKKGETDKRSNWGLVRKKKKLGEAAHFGRKEGRKEVKRRGERVSRGSSIRAIRSRRSK